MTENPTYGRPISKLDADKLFKNARDIESNKDALLKDKLASDPEALEYYGKPVYAFVFKKQPLQELLDKMVADNHYLVLLTGSKKGAAGNSKRIIMAMVYQEDPAGSLTLDQQPLLAGGIGTQHPGILVTVGSTAEIPINISLSDVETSDSPESSAS